MLARREVDERAQCLAAADASDDEQVDAAVVEERARRELRGGREPARVARPHGEEWRLERAPRLAALRLEAQPARVLPLREHQPEGPHVEASLAHPAEVLRAEVEVRGEGPLHREEAVEEAPLRRLRDAHHVEPLSAATAEEARRRNRPGRLSRRLERRGTESSSSPTAPPLLRRLSLFSLFALSSETHSEFAEPPGSTPIERAETAASASSRAKRPLTSSCTTPSPPTHTTASTSAGSICAAISLTCPACVVTTSVSATRCASKRGRQRA
mmetsp:Transcript_45289/g.145716  ORF Transcript_45289/g.145716 Transcript_45289/m.145716 type:complete len:271 (+) Transcript_45289:1146-1958(+)